MRNLEKVQNLFKVCFLPLISYDGTFLFQLFLFQLFLMMELFFLKEKFGRKVWKKILTTYNFYDTL